MSQKLITVTWSATISMEVPNDIDINDLVESDFRSGLFIQELAAKATKEAYDNIGWKDGIITDVQEP